MSVDEPAARAVACSVDQHKVWFAGLAGSCSSTSQAVLRALGAESNEAIGSEEETVGAVACSVVVVGG